MSLGEVSAIIAGIGVVPYIISIFRGSVRPERVSWFIWSVILAVGLWSYHVSGAGDAAWLLIGDLTATGTVFIVSLWRGRGGWCKTDLICLSVAIVGIGLWKLFANSWLGVGGAILADIVALLPTLAKSLNDPTSESSSTYAFSALASCFGFLAVGSWDLLEMSYPIYLFLANFTTALTIVVSQYQMYSKQCSPILFDK